MKYVRKFFDQAAIGFLAFVPLTLLALTVSGCRPDAGVTNAGVAKSPAAQSATNSVATESDEQHEEPSQPLVRQIGSADGDARISSAGEQQTSKQNPTKQGASTSASLPAGSSNRQANGHYQK